MNHPHQKELAAYLEQYIKDTSAFQRVVAQKVAALEQERSAERTARTRDDAGQRDVPRQSESAHQRGEPSQESTQSPQAQTTISPTDIADPPQEGEGLLRRLGAIAEVKTWVAEAESIISTLEASEDDRSMMQLGRLHKAISQAKKLKLPRWTKQFVQLKQSCDQLGSRPNKDDVEDLKDELNEYLQVLTSVRQRWPESRQWDGLLAALDALIARYDQLKQTLSRPLNAAAGSDEQQEARAKQVSTRAEDLRSERESPPSTGTAHDAVAREYRSIIDAISAMSSTNALETWQHTAARLQERIVLFEQHNRALSAPLETSELASLSPILAAGLAVSLTDLTDELRSLEASYTILVETPDSLQLAGLQARLGEVVDVIAARQLELYQIGQPILGIATALDALKHTARALVEKVQLLTSPLTTEDDQDKKHADLSARFESIEAGMRSLATIAEYTAWRESTAALSRDLESWLAHYTTPPAAELSSQLMTLTSWRGILSTGLAIMDDLLQLTAQVSQLVAAEPGSDGGAALLSSAAAMQQSVTAIGSRMASLEGSLFQSIRAELPKLSADIAARISALEALESRAADRAAQHQELRERYDAIETDIEALSGINDVPLWESTARALLTSLDAWLARYAEQSSEGFTAEAAAVEGWRASVRDGSPIVAELTIIETTQDELAQALGVSTRGEALTQHERASALATSLARFTTQLATRGDATPIYKALLQYLEGERVELEQKREAFQDLIDELPEGEGDAQLEDERDSPQALAALQQQLSALKLEEDPENWLKQASALSADLARWDKLPHEHDNPLAGIADHTSTCSGDVTALLQTTKRYQQLQTKVSGLVLERDDATALQHAIHELEAALLTHREDLERLNRRHALLTGLLSTLARVAQDAQALAAAVVDTLSRVLEHAQLLKDIARDHQEILSRLAALAQISSLTLWHREATSTVALIDEWTSLNSQRRDGASPSDSESLEMEKNSLSGALEWVAALTTIEEQILQLQSASTSLASAPAVEPLQALLAELDEPSSKLATARASLQPFARRLQLHHCLASVLGTTSEMKEQLSELETQTTARLETAERARVDRNTSTEMQALYEDIERGTHALATIEGVDIWRSDATALETLIDRWREQNSTLVLSETSRLKLLQAQRTILHKGTAGIARQETLRASVITLSGEIDTLTSITARHAAAQRARIDTLRASIHAEQERLRHSGSAAITTPFAALINKLDEQPAMLDALLAALDRLETAALEDSEALEHLAAIPTRIQSAVVALNSEPRSQRWAASARRLQPTLEQWRSENEALGTHGDADTLRQLERWESTIHDAIITCGALDDVAADYDSLSGQVVSLGEAPSAALIIPLMERLSALCEALDAHTGHLHSLPEAASMVSALLANGATLHQKISARVQTLEEALAATEA